MQYSILPGEGDSPKVSSHSFTLSSCSLRGLIHCGHPLHLWLLHLESSCIQWEGSPLIDGCSSFHTEEMTIAFSSIINNKKPLQFVVDLCHFLLFGTCQHRALQSWLQQMPPTCFQMRGTFEMLLLVYILLLFSHGQTLLYDDVNLRLPFQLMKFTGWI